MKISLRCRCGGVQGDVDCRRAYGHAVCYCRDCQAFARFLGNPDKILNGNNGTEILAILPAAVHFSEGKENLAVMRLSDKGLMRWYARCCRTPIGNTPADPKIAYVGLIATCLPELGDRVGQPKIALNTDSAKGTVKATPVATFFGVVRIMKHVTGARLSGKFRDNPFFSLPSREPVIAP